MGLAAMSEHGQESGHDVGSKPYNDAAQLTKDLNAVITSLQSQVAQWQVSTIIEGTNITKLFYGGGMIEQQYFEFNTLTMGKAEWWLQQYILVKLINHAWWNQNVFITFMPVSLAPSHLLSFP